MTILNLVVPRRAHASTKVGTAILCILALGASLLVPQNAHAASEAQTQPICVAGKPDADTVAECTKILALQDVSSSGRINALALRGNSYVRLGQMGPAIDDFEILLKLKYSPGLAFLLSELYLNTGRENDAITEMSKLVDAGVANAQVFGLRGAAYQNAGNFDASIEDFNKVLLLNPKDLTALNNRATAYSKKGDYGRAVKDLDAVLAIDPGMSIALANRCAMFAKDGHLDQGLPSCTKAEHLSPDQPIVLEGIAAAYYAATRYEDALRYINRAMLLMPGNPMTLYWRGLTKTKLGLRSEGEADMAEAARQKPDVAALMERSGMK